ncbi:MAG: prenyltransferase [Clostridiaceae bacterium]
MSFKSLIKLMDLRTLVAGITPVFLGSMYSAYAYKKFNALYFILLIISMILLQSAANMINDFFDFNRGADFNKSGDEKALVNGDVTPKQVLLIIFFYQSIALTMGIFIAYKTSFYILFVATVGIVISILYAFGPFPISYTPFGEIISGVTMGIGITTTVIYIHSGEFNLTTVLVAIPTVFYIGTILLSNNLSDLEEDKSSGRKTLPILIGVKRSEKLWVFNVWFLFILTLFLIIIDIYPLIILISVILLFPYKTISKFSSYEKNITTKERTMGLIGKIGVRYHLSIIIGLFISIILLR